MKLSETIRNWEFCRLRRKIIRFGDHDQAACYLPAKDVLLRNNIKHMIKSVIMEL